MSLYGDTKKPRKSNKSFACLVSFCIFFLTLSVCLMTVLVFVGKYVLYSTCEVRRHRPLLNRHIPLVQKEFWRLPNDVEPLLYNVTLMPDLVSGLYKGFVNITVDVKSSKKDIVLHSQKLVLSDIGLTNSNLNNYQVLKTEEIADYQVVVITTKQKISPGIYYIFIRFEGTLLGKSTGFYHSQYKNSNGTLRQIATSKFEPTYARQAFPCFDEPNMKAKYKVHLLKPKDPSYIALSNYPVSSISDYDKENQLVTFDETVSMSTYLSCFIVSDFTHIETSFDNNGTKIPLKVYASPANLQKTQYAGDVGKKVIEYYVNYFQIPFPLPKLDMVAIPDFVSGAMEHWGLVTYRETALLYTPTTHSSANKQRVAAVVAHELAHSWFGNLVTMNWWNDLWLNEGFASYIQYKGTLAAEPTWGMLDQFLTGTLHPVLAIDSILSSHPIVCTVLTPDQITEIFDTISYNKGASVLRMLENAVKEKNFQQGVNNYLNLYAYKNAVTEDLLNEIQRIVGNVLDVKEMMDTFTVQMGYPILTVTSSGNEYTLTQKRFLKDPNATYNETESKYRYKWSVPVTYVTDLGKSKSITLFKYNEDSVKIMKPDGAKWIKFNYDQVGYYRVNYQQAEWENIINYYNDLSNADRTHLLEETFSIAEADQLNYVVPLDLTKKLEKELGYTPWCVANSKLVAVLRYLRGSNSVQESAFKKYIIKIVTPAYNKFTWTENTNDTHLERLARIEVLSLACAVDYEACLTEAQSYFNKWIETKQALSPDLRTLIYAYGMKKANITTWNTLLEIYKAEDDASEKLKLINGLANVGNTDILKSLLELAKDETIVRSQDFFTVLQYISTNPNGTELVWDWVRSNWNYLAERFTLNDRYLGSLIPAITSRFATAEKLTEMQTFFKDNPEAGAGLANRKKAIEAVQNNIRWLSKYKTTVEEWLLKNSTV